MAGSELVTEEMQRAAYEAYAATIREHVANQKPANVLDAVDAALTAVAPMIAARERERLAVASVNHFGADADAFAAWLRRGPGPGGPA